MGKSIVYDGPTDEADVSRALVIDGVRLRKGVPTDVSDELAAELLGGSDRLAGHEFSEAGSAKPTPPETDAGDDGDPATPPGGASAQGRS